jgi:hypothetical protein
MLAVVGIFTVSGGYAWPVVVLGWVLIVAGVGIGGWAWNRRRRGGDDQEGWLRGRSDDERRIGKPRSGAATLKGRKETRACAALISSRDGCRR